MFAVNQEGAANAYQEWLAQGSESPPTNGDVVRHYKMDEELLQHLAAFMWSKGFDAARNSR